MFVGVRLVTLGGWSRKNQPILDQLETKRASLGALQHILNNNKEDFPMAVNLPPLTQLLPIAGVRVGTACAGIKQTERDDLSLFEFCPGTTHAAVFTRNAFCAAPVEIARQHLATTEPRYWLINTGNANAGTGEAGRKAALACCAQVAHTQKCSDREVLPFSTGVIGEPLPLEKIQAAIPQAAENLSADHWLQAANAIMTTDTQPKGTSRQIDIQGQPVTITGIAKGSGMIHPNMATMLAFIATDAAVAEPLLLACLQDAVKQSFNRISVDGDTSTNDACLLAATGKSSLPLIDQQDSAAFIAFKQAVLEVCQTLAQSIVRDGEGASKFISVQVEEGRDAQECLAVAYSIAQSPLVKTAFFASDPNWGRLLAAIGRAPVSALDIQAVRVFLGDVCIVEDGGRASSYSEARGKAVMQQAEIGIKVLLGRGAATETVWTCDLSYDYVKINAEYRT